MFLIPISLFLFLSLFLSGEEARILHRVLHFVHISRRPYRTSFSVSRQSYRFCHLTRRPPPAPLSSYIHPLNASFVRQHFPHYGFSSRSICPSNSGQNRLGQVHATSPLEREAWRALIVRGNNNKENKACPVIKPRRLPVSLLNDNVSIVFINKFPKRPSICLVLRNQDRHVNSHGISRNKWQIYNNFFLHKQINLRLIGLLINVYTCIYYL